MLSIIYGKLIPLRLRLLEIIVTVDEEQGNKIAAIYLSKGFNIIAWGLE